MAKKPVQVLTEAGKAPKPPVATQSMTAAASIPEAVAEMIAAVDALPQNGSRATDRQMDRLLDARVKLEEWVVTLAHGACGRRTGIHLDQHDLVTLIAALQQAGVRLLVGDAKDGPAPNPPHPHSKTDADGNKEGPATNVPNP